MQEPVPADPQVVRPSLVQLTHIIYDLHAIAVLVGVTSAATVAGGFVFGLPSLLAVFLNYLKRSDVNGTRLEIHIGPPALPRRLGSDRAGGAGSCVEPRSPGREPLAVRGVPPPGRHDRRRHTVSRA